MSTKTQPETLHVGVLIDESGSMSGLEPTVIGGFNEFTGKLKAEQSETPTKVTLAMFDLSGNDEPVRFKFKGIPLDEVEPIGPGDYKPRGATPLNDAVVKSIHALDRKAKKRDRVMLVVLTDGLENSSEVSTKVVRELILAKEKAGWEFMYLGANQDAWAESQELGVTQPGRAFNFAASPDGTADAVDFAAERVASYRANPDVYEDEAQDLGPSVPESPRRE